jgi:hypothetical protein
LVLLRKEERTFCLLELEIEKYYLMTFVYFLVVQNYFII